MASFIERAECRGRRPVQFASFEGRHRPGLITSMLKERDVARFIVAPDGYGKTSLAFEYADTIFSWANTYWINGESPCFIRDLDAGIIAESCLGGADKPGLVVFDALPLLDSERAEVFSREIDALLESDCEVLVTCVPSHDAFGRLQRDRMRLSAEKLLLDDDEIDETRTPDERMRTETSLIPASQRVPALVWGEGEGFAREFARDALGEEMPSDLSLGMCSIMVLREGALDELQAVGVIDAAALSEVAADYPHLGLDESQVSFSASSLSISDLAPVLRRRLGTLTLGSVFASREQLVCTWARLLLAGGDPARACDLVREVCPRSARASWLLEAAPALISQACFLPAYRLARDQENVKGPIKLRLMAIRALCCKVLGAAEEALKSAKRCGFDESLPVGSRVCGLIVMAEEGDEALAEEALMELGKIGGGAVREDVREAGLWAQLAEIWCAGARGIDVLEGLWERYRDDGVERMARCLCTARLFRLYARIAEQSKDPLVPRGGVCALAEAYVREVLTAADTPRIDYFAASAGLAFEQARQAGLCTSGNPLPTAAMLSLRQFEMGVVMQRRRLEDDARRLLARQGDWSATHPEVYTTHKSRPLNAKRASAVPTLTLRMFGKFEVSIGDDMVDPASLRRQNVRVLLVLLAVNQGKELSRDAVSKVMWPHSTDDMARKNFYSVWAKLRHALMLPDGTCPYLVRHQFGCSLEQRYVDSDATRLSEICRELLFGVPDVDHWSLLFAEIDRDFASDLMPGESKNLMVVQARNEYRSRLIDALVAATSSVIDIGNPQWGVWFARAAISHDETREDAYVALMRAQIAGNQRTAAMMTFLKCRRVLSDKLGIDPSPETTTLYESLLDT